MRDWTDNWGLNVCQSPVPWAGQGKWPSLSLKLCVTRPRVFRFAQRRPSDRCRWSSNDLCFSLCQNSDTRSPPLRREERLHGLFFLVWEQFLSFELIEEERKASKRQSSSDRWIEESRKKKVIVSSFGVHAYMSKIDQMQGRASRAIDRAPAPERPRLCNDLRNRRPESPCEFLRPTYDEQLVAFQFACSTQSVVTLCKQFLLDWYVWSDLDRRPWLEASVERKQVNPHEHRSRLQKKKKRKKKHAFFERNRGEKQAQHTADVADSAQLLPLRLLQWQKSCQHKLNFKTHCLPCCTLLCFRRRVSIEHCLPKILSRLLANILILTSWSTYWNSVNASTRVFKFANASACDCSESLPKPGMPRSSSFLRLTDSRTGKSGFFKLLFSTCSGTRRGSKSGLLSACKARYCSQSSSFSKITKNTNNTRTQRTSLNVWLHFKALRSHIEHFFLSGIVTQITCTSSLYKSSLLHVFSADISEVLQYVLLAKKPYERCLRSATPFLYDILGRKPRKSEPRYGFLTKPIFPHLGRFVLRRDSHLFDLGTRGWEAHSFFCVEEGDEPHPGF